MFIYPRFYCWDCGSDNGCRTDPVDDGFVICYPCGAINDLRKMDEMYGKKPEENNVEKDI